MTTYSSAYREVYIDTLTGKCVNMRAQKQRPVKTARQMAREHEFREHMKTARKRKSGHEGVRTERLAVPLPYQEAQRINPQPPAEPEDLAPRCRKAPKLFSEEQAATTNLERTGSKRKTVPLFETADSFTPVTTAGDNQDQNIVDTLREENHKLLTELRAREAQLNQALATVNSLQKVEELDNVQVWGEDM